MSNCVHMELTPSTCIINVCHILDYSLTILFQWLYNHVSLYNGFIMCFWIISTCIFGSLLQTEYPQTYLTDLDTFTSYLLPSCLLENVNHCSQMSLKSAGFLSALRNDLFLLVLLFKLYCNFHVATTKTGDEQLDKSASCLDLSGEATKHSRVSEVSLRLPLVSAFLLTW